MAEKNNLGSEMHISDEGINIIKHFEGCPIDEDGNCVDNWFWTHQRCTRR